MTHKERILATLQGQATDRLPFLPRLDLWYRANKINGTLPAKYKNAELRQILEDMDLGFHAVIPDFQDLQGPDDDIDRALGLYRLWFMPYKPILNNVKRKIKYEKDVTIVEYITPKGSITTKVLYDDNMKRAGITITHISEYALKTKQDIEPLCYIFDNIEVLPNYDGYNRFKESVGDDGVAVAYMSLAASPMHMIMRELIKMDDFFLMQYDCPDEIAKLSEKIERYYSRILAVAADSSAEVVISGANYDSSVTNPVFFEKYITPALKYQSKILHEKGKFLLTHTDGENKGLLNQYLEAEIDIADSVCPSPMTNLSFREYRNIFGDRITIWGGIPSTVMLEDSMSDCEFNKYLDNFFSEIGNIGHLIVSVADTMPPAAKFERIEMIAKMAMDFKKT
jgi:uroporphyrinogen-III decarboxylase